eukprot:TRINITY_DN3468_c0_g1_i1.p2 TRINITY_DN3468_c0_g1~~TRINITY_DN3468_c0_g1_i1.p2  ORF type:complete len:149 (+),score=32.49 TRINITY_DN3468_c0_g1_i1:16-462(+)
MMATPSCVFCAIAAGTAPASVVLRDNARGVIVFMDTSPVAEGHALVAPLVHASRLADLPPGAAARLFAAAADVAATLYRAGLCGASTLVLNDGADAGQAVAHAHVHVIPRRARDGMGFESPTPTPTSTHDRDELDRVATRIRTALASS